MNSIGAAIGALIGCALVHGAIRRLRPLGNSVLQFVAVAGFGTIALTLAALRTKPVTVPERVVSVTEFIFLSELYLFTFTLAISSISVATLLRLAGWAASAPKPAIPGVESVGNLPRNRIAALTGAGLVKSDRPAYSVTRLGRAVLRVRRALRVFFGHASAKGAVP